MVLRHWFEETTPASLTRGAGVVEKASLWPEARASAVQLCGLEKRAAALGASFPLSWSRIPSIMAPRGDSVIDDTPRRLFGAGRSCDNCYCDFQAHP